MIWKILRFLLLALVFVVAAAYAYIRLGLPKAGPSRTTQVDRSPARVERGKYLFEVVSGCGHCHSELDENRFSGPVKAGGLAKGRMFPDVPGTLAAPNLTSDNETGVGQWTDGELIRAIREGISRDGRPLFPSMPYLDFATLSDEDVESIVAYIRTIPASPNALPKPDIQFPMSLIMRMLPKPVGSVAPVNPADRLAYGKHLTGISGCQFCHTPLEKGRPVKEKEFSGGHPFPTGPNAKAVSANLTPDANTGIGTMTEAQFLDKFYQYKDYAEKGAPVIQPELNSPMPWVALSRLAPDDLRAIYAYLKTVTPIANAVVTHPDAPEEKKTAQ